MLRVYSKSSRGYSHIRSRKKCQDFSSSYQSNDRIIITCCDGHGGSKYIRSHIGSHMASNAIMNVFNSLTKSLLRLKEEEIVNKIRLSILCEWNKLIEEEISSKPVSKNELSGLNDEQIFDLKVNHTIAYGTTLCGAVLINNKLIAVKIGDTECIGIKRGKLVEIFDSSTDPAANVTYSMCQDDAYNYIQVRILDFNDLDGIILCTDGLTSPYQSYDNFNNSFIKPMVYKIINDNNILHIDNFISLLASKLGVGDDVSLSFILNENIQHKYYR